MLDMSKRQKKNWRSQREWGLHEKKALQTQLGSFQAVFSHSQWRINLEGMSWGNWDWRGKQITDFD